ncbi:MAG TPA: ribosome biogenesis GTPase Der [Gemmataceae bacterium]|nr:ribosome biogenesis GTPase Der [Gemmataceae bacterium]
MAVPLVAIVGRPNVGKSALFNCLAGRRISIVDPTAGVTRDRISTLVEAEGRFFEIMDTGGIGIEDVDNLTAEVERQITTGIDDAAVILFVVDIRAGLTPLDEEVGRRLRYVTKPVILVANKCDDPAMIPLANDFYKLGRGKALAVSAEQKRGRDALLRIVLENLPTPGDEESPAATDLKLAIVGRRNVGKSTFINSLTKAERMIVSEVPGTTRDSVDVRFERDGKQFVAIDTAGVRKKKSISSNLEFYSLARAERSIRRADVVLMFFDPRVRISQVDKKLTEYILDQYKPAIFVVNKWDLMKESMPTEKFATYLRSVFPMLDYVPIAFITAKSGKNVYKLLNLAQHLHKQASARLGTGELNKVIRGALDVQPPPLRQNRRAKIYFATQVATNPPTIVLFTNGPQLFDNTYERYLVKFLRDHSPFAEVPIKVHLRAKKRGETPPPDDTVLETGPGSRRKSKSKRTSGPDLSKLRFKSEVSDEELEREAKQATESELWRDL